MRKGTILVTDTDKYRSITDRIAEIMYINGLYKIDKYQIFTEIDSDEVAAYVVRIHGNAFAVFVLEKLSGLRIKGSFGKKQIDNDGIWHEFKIEGAG